MQYETLGNTDVEVSRVGLGLWNISGGSDWEKTDEDQAVKTIHAAHDAGVNFFDTAEAYGDGYSEEVLGKTLDSLDRDDVVVASKVSPDNLAYDDLKASCEASLDRLSTDYIDVYYVHYQNPEIPISETMRALKELQEEGRIRVLAVSNTGPADLKATLEAGRVEANQVPYNLLWRAIEHEVAGGCRESNVDLVAYSPLAQGLLTGEYDAIEEYPTGRMRTRHFSRDRLEARHSETGTERETFETIERIRDLCEEYDRDMVEVALAWPLHQPRVTSVLAGASSPEHARANAAAADVSLSEDLLADLDDATSDLKATLGPNPDPWQSDSRYN
ncbi:aldo/keto reductase [Halococcus salifodinae]|uniref:NADP-dependent oxidoreductase domain-containing protein n=1 Tax=Halococcus salifodinae DSM 8989 TaxID=1227456 RepID=M0N980_9EURY|nr:aldo/keto reductase [Halococcus salifodinae]EMA54436.1 hypothetical protein C450_06395 [Halococcus salifodinae DSM 8989]